VLLDEVQCGLGRTTAASGGVKLVVTPASAELASKSTQFLSGAMNE
jgi:acetylornithine/succinyldiaminopimelate/putrescine aminotransferase